MPDVKAAAHGPPEGAHVEETMDFIIRIRGCPSFDGKQALFDRWRAWLDAMRPGEWSWEELAYSSELNSMASEAYLHMLRDTRHMNEEYAGMVDWYRSSLEQSRREAGHYQMLAGYYADVLSGRGICPVA